MTREPWYESDNPSRVARGFSWRLAIGIVVAVLFVGGISIAYWGFGVGTSDVKGQGDAVKRKNSADNRIAEQAAFEKLYADIKAADARIDVFAAAKREQPTDTVAKTNYTGSLTICGQLVADYNAKARSYTAEQWRAADLPAQIDPTDPATDCKETAK